MSSIFGKLLDVVLPPDDAEAALPEVPGGTSVDPLAGFSAGTDTPAASSTAPVSPAKTSLDWTLDDIFKAGKVEPGRNSAETVLKLLGGLQSLPADARLVAIRAMDAADDTWDEPTVIQDAQRRIAVLGKYQEFVDKDVAAATQKEIATYETLRTANEGKVTDIDARIKALQDERETIAHEVTTAKAEGEGRVKAIQVRAADAKQRAKDAATKYDALVKFFGGVKA